MLGRESRKSWKSSCVKRRFFRAEAALAGVVPFMGVAPFSENLWASLRIELITKTDRMKEEGRASRQGKTGIHIDFVPKQKDYITN